MFSEHHEYDIALSFAGEDRGHVEPIAQQLRDKGVRVFYDGFEQGALWGKDLTTHFAQLYRSKAIYCIVFVSHHYANKRWTSRVELPAAQAGAFERTEEYILPVRLDDTEVGAILPTTAYLDFNAAGVEGVVNGTMRKLELYRKRASSA